MATAEAVIQWATNRLGGARMILRPGWFTGTTPATSDAEGAAGGTPHEARPNEARSGAPAVRSALSSIIAKVAGQHLGDSVL